jgi:hypothetical protein
VQRAFAGAALAELEAQRLPPALVRAFAGIERVPPGTMRDLRLAESLTDPSVLPLWQTGCAAGPMAVANAMSVQRSQAAGFFCATCSALCERLGGAPPGASAASVAACALAADHLARNGSLDPVEQQLLRAAAMNDGSE